MTMLSRFARLFAAVVALAAVWPISPSIAESDVGAAVHVAQIAIDRDRLDMTDFDSAPCGFDPHGPRDGCCGSASIACCPACVLVPAEATTFGPDAAQVFAATLAEAAAGIVPARLKKPPRPARR